MRRDRIFVVSIVIVLLGIGTLTAYYLLFLNPSESNTVKIGYSTIMSVSFVPDLVATETYLPEYGVKAEPSYFEGDPLNVKAVIAGTVDIGGFAGGVSIIAANEAGANLKVFACPLWKPTFLLVSKDTFKSPKDLEGKRFGISAPGSDSHVLAVIFLEEEGVNVESVNWLQIGSSGSRAKALLSEEIDATLLPAQIALELLSNEGFHKLGSLTEVVPSYVFGGYFATEEYIQKHPDVILAFTKSLIRATRQVQDGMVFLEKAEEEFPDMSTKMITDIHDLFIENQFWSTDGGISEDVADFTYELAVRLGIAQEKKPMSVWMTTEFVDKALEELGPYESSAQIFLPGLQPSLYVDLRQHHNPLPSFLKVQG